jgi:hypothetical protein
MIKREDRPYQAAYFNSDWAFARGFYLAWEPRLGKTYAETRATLRRQQEANCKRTLVVGPKNPLLMTWCDELADAGFARPSQGGGPAGYLVPLADGEMIARAEVLKCLIKGDAGDAPVALLVNFEALDDYFERIIREEEGYRFRKRVFESLKEAKLARARSTAQTMGQLIYDWHPENIIIDEAHLISTAGARRSRALRRICRDAKYVRLLSGTPDPKRAPSFYAQYVCLDPTIFGTSRERFVEKYFHVNPYQIGRIEGLKEEMEGEFYQKVYSVMSVVVTEDHFTTEKPNIVTRDIHWTPAAREVYDRLLKDSVLFGNVGPEEFELSVDGTHKLTKGLRLRQLCAGFLEDEMSGAIRWIHRSKQDAIVADLAEPFSIGQRVVISYQFTESGENLVAAIEKAYGKGTAALANSQTHQITQLLRLFDVHNQTETPIRALVLQEQVGGAGISLARARHLFFHSWSMDSAIHEQMRRRIWDPSRAGNITYYQMVRSADGFARQVVDNKINASVMAKRIGLLAAFTGGTNDGRTGELYSVSALQRGEAPALARGRA